MTDTYWHARRVTVTGAAGFIGSHLVERLATLGARVTAIDRVPAHFPALDRVSRDRIAPVCGDLESFPWERHFLDEAPDALFHLAGTSSVGGSIDSPAVDFETNAVQTVRLLEAARGAGYRGAILYQSSAAVYGRPTRLPVHEDDPTRPISPYGVSKLACERYLTVYCELFGLRGASLRAFSVYGARQRKLFVYDVLRRLAESPERMWLAGDGEQTRDFIHVDDVVSALLVAAARAPLSGEVYNVATGDSRSINELLDSLATVMGVELGGIERRPARKGDPERWSADISLIRALGFAPHVELREGLLRTVEWYRSSPETP
jgi:UDP-glucose 4-epimerase